jgi:uncharacterized spore protein YtfJ
VEIKGFVQSLMDRLQGRAGAATVYGEPIVAEGKTVIPCAKVAFGFGGGGGIRRAGAADEPEAGREGHGGGGGIACKPIGVVEITPAGTRFIAFEDTRRLVGAVLAGVVLGLWIGRRWSRS